MPRREPLEPDSFTIEIDPGGERIPFDEEFSEAERQAAEIVAPYQLDMPSCSKIEHDRWNRLIAERVQLRQMGEVWVVHEEPP